MLTPLFTIDQSDNELTCTIIAPLAKISTVEVSVCDKELFFSAKPYFLRLYLPKEIVEDGKEATVYNSDTGSFTITVSKKNPGEYFSGLDMITKLLTPKGFSTAKPLVEEVGDEDGDDDDNVYFEQKVDLSVDYAAPSVSNSCNYGFANCRSQIFSNLKAEIAYIVDIQDPDNIKNEDRINIAFEIEKEKFSDDHYLADHFSSDEIEALISFIPWWYKSNNNPTLLTFDKNENERLKSFPRRAFLNFDQNMINIASCSMLNILFAYAYNNRITEGENNCESGWLISKLSPTLSCFISYDDVQQCMTAVIRRSLCFPLYRSWRLSMKILEDVKNLCKLGKKAILKCFIEIHEIFAKSGDYLYIFNDLYITDYCIWIPYAEDQIFLNMLRRLEKIQFNKVHINLDLLELESAAESCLEEDDLKEKLQESVQTRVMRHTHGRRTIDSDDSSDEENIAGPIIGELERKLAEIKI